MLRKVKNIYDAPEVMMGDTRLRQAIPMSGLQKIGPFILLHHFDKKMEAHGEGFHVPAHPHRGFCPITFMFEGSIEHNDSLGNSEVIHGDEVQWINAGRGIIHSETAGKDLIETGGRFQGIQLWINLRSEDKMKTPSYQPITKNEMVLIEAPGIEFRLVSGKFDGKIGPAISATITAMLRMQKESNYEFELPATNQSAMYVLEGSVEVNETQTCNQHSLIHFANDEGKIVLRAHDHAKLLIMSGEDIHEPIVSHGPFVMNTQTEILQAMKDYQEGRMGFLY
ncbi:MAG: pirin family protein [Bacteroidetes bacterium]|nr:pirin family protein [Bacteroidota bacterium]